METKHYLRALLHGWYFVLVGLAIGSSLGYAYFAHATPRYRATTQLSIGYTGNQLVDETQAQILAEHRAGTLIQLVGTPPVIQAAIQRAGVVNPHPGVTAWGTGNNIIAISVADDDPLTAAKIANAFQYVLPDQLFKLIGPTDSQVKLTPVQVASPATAPFSPKFLPRAGLGGIVGLGLGCMVAALRAVSDRRVRTLDEAQDATDLPILGVIPHQHRRSRLPIETHPDSRRAEAYRQIRTGILASMKTVHVISVSSTRAAEGKTSVVINVAVSLSRSGLRILVIDADMRRPRIASALNVPGTPGLSQVLSGEIGVTAAVHHGHGRGPDVLAAGAAPINPSELLDNDRFADVIAWARAHYDLVLVDTAPTMAVADGRIVAAHMDETILVTRLGHVTPADIRTSLRSLSGGRVAGLVVNGARVGTSWI